MDRYRVSIVWTDGRVSVIDKSFSQVVELLRDMTPTSKDMFWNKERVDLPTGGSVAFVKEV